MIFHMPNKRTETLTLQIETYSYLRCSRYRSFTATEYRTNAKTCCPGWTGGSCNIPVCNPKCENDAICYDKDKCFCRTGNQGGSCDIAKCSSQTNCFPGTCHNGNDTCICVSGFGGTNCNTMDISPIFKKCQMNLMATSDGDEKVVFTGACDSVKTYFSNGRNVAFITMSWETHYEKQTDLPHRPPYIGQYSMGVVSTSGNVTLWNADKDVIYNEPISCPSPVNSSNPHLVSECRNVRHKLKSGVGHGYQIEVTMAASTGGYKKVHNTETDKMDDQFFTGQSSSRTVRVTIDLLPPTHCTTTRNCSSEDAAPVGVGREIDNINYSKRFVRCAQWYDGDSRLKNFSYQVFPLAPDSKGLLMEKSTPIVERKQASSW
ncbi:hypothetical protein LSAT2_010608 [Lamellibrachia satsuma]|nr:hypothetical protein LSAT2_010608 [Lamellibrachia satsuma]